MSDAIFPSSSLPGLVLGGRETYYGDEVQEGDTGMEYRINRYTAPRFRYSYDAQFLRATLSEFETLHGFFVGHGGRRDSFLLVDPVDGVTRRVRFDEPSLECEQIVQGVYSCQFDLVSVVG